MPARLPITLRAAALGAALSVPMIAPARAMVINVTYDSSVTSNANAAAIQSAFENVVGHFEAAFANPISVNVHVGWGKVNTATIGAGKVGETRVMAAGGFRTFAATSALLQTGGVTVPLPSSDPTGTNRFLIPSAQAKALGMTGFTVPTYDAYIGFSSTYSFKQFDTAISPLLAYDFNGVAAHELEHALGRVSGLTASSPVFAYAADLLRYSAPGTNSFSYTATAYSSIDGGTTSLGTHNTALSADRIDWASPGTTRNSQNAQLETGKDYCLSTADQRFMTGLGYSFTSDADELYFSGTDCAPFGAAAASITAFPITVVDAPEPATLGLFALGAASLGLLRRRARRATA